MFPLSYSPFPKFSLTLVCMTAIVFSPGRTLAPPNSTSMRRLEDNEGTAVSSQPSLNRISKERCELMANELGSPFSSKHRLRGAPAGCIFINGNVVFVKTCRKHVNCGTSWCDGCSVLGIDQPASAVSIDESNSVTSPVDTMTAEERCEAKAGELGLNYSTQEKWRGAPAGCVRINDGRIMYVKTCSNHPYCGTLKCHRCTILDVTSEH